MATAVSDILMQGYRESNLVTINEVLTAAQTNEGLARLQSLVSGVFGWDVGENLQDWPVGVLNVKRDHWPTPTPNWNMWTINEWSYPIQNVRLLMDANEAQHIYLPAQPDNGARMRIVVLSQDLATHNVILDGNGRLVEGNPTLTLNDNSTAARVIMYDSETGDWVRVTGITAVSNMPFPEEFDDYFITKLAMRLNPRYGRAMAQESSARLDEVQSQLAARYRNKQDTPADPAVLRLSNPGRYGYIRAGGRYGWMS